MIPAVYYNELYLLLPDEYPDFESFMEHLKGQEMPVDIKMVVLRENHKIPCWSVVKGESIAPYFLSGYHDEPSTIRIDDPDNVYPVTVEVMDQAEYNRRLREVVTSFCPGCLRFKPLSNRVQSLNGHFEEISLDGVCFYRQETKPSPRVFREYLMYFGGAFLREKYARLDAASICNDIKRRLYINYPTSEIKEEYCKKKLIVSCKKKEILPPLLTAVLSEYIESWIDPSYSIELFDPVECTEAFLQTILSPENVVIYRKECKKYGVSIGVLEYRPEGESKVHSALEYLTDHNYMHPLFRRPGKEYYLLTDTANTLKALHYRSPVLASLGVRISIYSQYANKQYKIAFSMEDCDI